MEDNTKQEWYCWQTADNAPHNSILRPDIVLKKGQRLLMRTMAENLGASTTNGSSVQLKLELRPVKAGSGGGMTPEQLLGNIEYWAEKPRASTRLYASKSTSRADFEKESEKWI